VWLATTVLFVISAINPLVTLFRPTWTRFRVVLKVFVDFGLVVVLIWSLALGSWVILSDPSTATSDEAALVDGINTIIRISIAITIVMSALSGALEVRRFRQIQRLAA
jgi:hypothetical protein